MGKTKICFFMRQHFSVFVVMLWWKTQILLCTLESYGQTWYLSLCTNLLSFHVSTVLVDIDLLNIQFSRSNSVTL